MIFLFTVRIASALSLYWLVGGAVAYIQQYIVLRSDETEMEAEADQPSKDVSAIPEAEIVGKPIINNSKTKKANKKKRKRQ
jgi:membrane protein insertase Oxa1/YidC/SpoIIIJ